MGIFDKAKEAKKQRKEKQAELNKQRGAFLSGFCMSEYMGGYGTKMRAKGSLFFFENRVEFKVSTMFNPKLSFTIPTSDIIDVAVEGKDEVTRRVTVTRLVAVGLFAFALKKKGQDKETFITLTLKDGQEAIFHIDNYAPMVIKPKLSRVTALVRKNAPQQPSTSSISVADELAKLAKLKTDGIITQAEFDKKKNDLLS